MKLLTALSALQTALIAFLLLKMAGDSGPTTAPAATTVVQTAGNPFAPASAAASAGAASALDEARLRQIIREELAAHHAAEGETGRIAAAPIDPTEATRRKSAVAQQINYYRSIGKISEKQMADLELEISRLDPAGRKEMLSMLSRAINAQEIKTRL
jgi:hypothetical protein